MIKFDMENPALVERIAHRALELRRRANPNLPDRHRRSKTDYMMDIAAANNSCPLHLEALADASDFEFSHDVFGIERHLNRTTGQLENCFLPRFAR